MVFVLKTQVHGFFGTDFHEVSWHIATHEAVSLSGFLVQLMTSVKEPIQNGILIMSHTYKISTQTWSAHNGLGSRRFIFEDRHCSALFRLALLCSRNFVMSDRQRVWPRYNWLPSLMGLAGGSSIVYSETCL